MGIAIQPRRVDPPAIRRWLLEGLKLVGRHPLPWIVAALMSGGLTLLASASNVAIVLVSVVSYLLFIGLAHQLDSRRPEPSWPTLVPRHCLAVAMVHGAIFAAVLGLGGIALDLNSNNLWGAWYNPDRSWSALGPRVFGLSLGAFTPFLISFVVSSYMIPWAPGSSPFAYHLMALAGTDRMTAVRLSKEGHHLNRRAVYLLAGLPVVVTVLVFLVAVALAPLASCFCSAVSYVAYRDIFLGMACSREPVRESVVHKATVATR